MLNLDINSTDVKPNTYERVLAWTTDGQWTKVFFNGRNWLDEVKRHRIYNVAYWTRIPGSPC